MFDDLIRELEDLEHGVRVPIEMPLDQDGYMDRRCPSATCQAEFKVLFDDWRDKVRDEQVYCPICRGEAASGEWNTDDQAEYIQQVGLAYVSGRVSEAMERAAEAFNRQRHGVSFLSLSMSYTPGAPPVVVPAEAAEVMRQKFACEACGCRYSAIGAAFFCPACGHNSAVTAFDLAVESVRKTIAGLPHIREAVTVAHDPDAAANTVRDILENSLGRLVASFQRFAEAMFNRRPAAAAIKQPKNVFQRLKDSSDLWRTLIGRGYEDILTADEMKDLVRLFQQRHVIAHRDGVVDAEYITKSGDTTYAPGQRIVIREEAVVCLADLVVKLANHLR